MFRILGTTFCAMGLILIIASLAATLSSGIEEIAIGHLAVAIAQAGVFFLGALAAFKGVEVFK